MKSTRFVGVVVAFVMLPMFSMAEDASAQPRRFSTQLRGFEEVPSISTLGRGRFDATISENGEEIEYRLSYLNLTGTVTQAHLHFAQEGVNGGIMVFLCSNLGNGPAGTQACPPAGTRNNPATITGTIIESSVGGPAAQGVAPGEMAELLRALRAGAVYVNVHTDLFPGGEIRGQLGDDGDDD